MTLRHKGKDAGIVDLKIQLTVRLPTTTTTVRLPTTTTTVRLPTTTTTAHGPSEGEHLECWSRTWEFMAVFCFSMRVDNSGLPQDPYIWYYTMARSTREDRSVKVAKVSKPRANRMLA